MRHLFTLSSFDDFEVRGIVINTLTRFEISGERIEKAEKIGEAEQGEESHCTWRDLCPYVRNIIKGKEKPQSMEIKFALAEPEKLHKNAAALFIIMRYSSQITCVTGSSQKNFELNKIIDSEWDSWVIAFFKQLGITFTLDDS